MDAEALHKTKILLQVGQNIKPTGCKPTTDKTFDAVKYMREQRQKLSEKLSNMTKEEIIEYFRKKKFENPVKPGG